MTCRVGFRNAELQRDHYKSDWHRYNLKRKIVSLPPVTADNFAERLAAQEAQAAQSANDTSRYCSGMILVYYYLLYIFDIIIIMLYF